jgi:hypothetical protein
MDRPHPRVRPNCASFARITKPRSSSAVGLPVDSRWLEWNERVFAYRCGVERGDIPSRSHLGFADSLEDAQDIALNVPANVRQTFMELLAAVRVEVLDAKPPAMAAASQVGMMFFMESQKSVLQELATLTAGWNTSNIDLESVHRAARTLESMGLTNARDRI